MPESQNLGSVSTWQIKNMPDGLRRAIVERAAVEKLTVGELLTRIIVAVVEADWQVAGLVNPSATQSTGDDLARVERTIAAAVALGEARRMPPELRKRVNHLLLSGLPDAAGVFSGPDARSQPMKAVGHDSK